MAYRVTFTRRARKDLAAIDAHQRRMILAWIGSHLEGCENPCAIEGSKPLKGTKSGWRYRIGSYRVLATILNDELIVDVVRVGHRQNVYQNLPDI